MQVKSRSQQYLNPPEEDIPVTYVLQMSENGFPLPISRRGEQKRLIVPNESKGYRIRHDVDTS
jgi:hypothetical protein